ncbi:hypothetical protein [Solimicrobium silvestre]|uniref:Uncharacterized protein n=1 Tax=Solimicrobium silvestre TaxID=2099400 RepID=A0A2S9H3T2_9BURK|nr:hypothetical protein [Solimicrobium silvestre]PRC94642.1 hypothetical protein S2091_0645 [Solimicrobium silvestre]
MNLQTRLKNKLRTVLRIRTERVLPPPGPQPKIGSSIVRDRLRIRLKYPVTSEQWEWFTAHGWRTVDMRTNRREYASVSDKVLVKLLHMNGVERDVLHLRLVNKGSQENKANNVE